MAEAADGTIADRLAIEALNADFAHLLDTNQAEALAALFTEDALYQNGSRRSEGRAAIRAFLLARAGGDRTSRHFYSGLRIRFDAPDRASATSLWLSFAQDGPPPFRHAQPFAIADFADRYRRGADGTWRFAERLIRPLYVDPATPPPRAR